MTKVINLQEVKDLQAGNKEVFQLELNMFIQAIDFAEIRSEMSETILAREKLLRDIRTIRAMLDQA